jgi:hypothetical protein
MHRRLSAAWQEVKGAVLSREFWLLLLWLILTLGTLAWLAGMAIGHFDTYLRLKPLICEAGIGNRQFLVVTLLAPVSLVFTLSAFGELWLIREARRGGHRARWRHLLLFAGLAALSAWAVFQALAC